MSSRQPRTDEAYVIDAGMRMLKVCEALEGTNFEPVSIKRVMERTGFSYDFCRRALLTLKLARWATEGPDGWQAGPRLLRFSEAFGRYCIAAMQENPNSENQNLDSPKPDFF